ncbi:MAG: SBBP repeat-containing protein, partial [Acidimicrobiales bacterium]
MWRLPRPLALAGAALAVVVAGSGSVAGGVDVGRRAGAVRAGSSPSAAAARAGATAALARAPVAFQPDATEAGRFVARGPAYGVAVSADGAVVAGADGAPLRLRFDGARRTATAAGRHPLPGTANVLVGDDPSQWRTGVPTFAQVAYDGVWDGVDVVWHGSGPDLEHDFVVAPGADVGAIAVSFPDARDVRLGGGGDLEVTLADGHSARLARPALYQKVGGRRVPVAGSFALGPGGRVGFTAGPHDPARQLVIDPVLVGATYLGGTSTDSGYGVAVDGAGNTYVTGFTESTDFPTASPLQPALVEAAGVRTDAFVVKLNPTGAPVYSTYLGGRGRDIGFAVAVGADGSAYVAGYTESTDFPTARPVQKTFGGGPGDAFVAKVGPQGAVLQYSTFLGGGGTDGARGVAVDGSGSAYVVGSTSSNDFPTAGPPVQGTPNHPDDTAAFATKLNPAGSAWVYSTYLGGSGDDHAMGVAVDASGSAFVAGDTRSSDFPVVRPIQSAPGSPSGTGAANADAFVLKLDPSGSSVVYATYLGGSDADQGAGIAIDGSGAAYVTGSTGSVNFPVAKPAQAKKNGDFDAFVSKLAPDGQSLVYSTFLGGSGSDGGAAIAVDGNGRASITGATASTDLPTATAFQATKAGGFVDGFVTTLSASGSSLASSSFLGGRDEDQGTAIAAGTDGSLYVTGYTNSADFPTAKPFQPAKGGGVGDAFVVRVAAAGPAASSGAGPVSPARERRVRIFLGLTIVLLAAAILQTVWLRRRRIEPGPAFPMPVGGGVRVSSSSSVSTLPSIGAPAPEPAGAGAAAGVEGPTAGGEAAANAGVGGPVDGEWYRPAPPRLSDLPTIRPRPRARPRPVPGDGARGRRARRPPAPADGARTGGDLPVPELLPDDPEEWATERPPGDEPWVDEEVPADALGGMPDAPPLQPLDLSAPDLWGPIDAEPELADDAAWAGLLASESAGAPGAGEGSPIPPPPPLAAVLPEEWDLWDDPVTADHGPTRAQTGSGAAADVESVDATELAADTGPAADRGPVDATELAADTGPAADRGPVDASELAADTGLPTDTGLPADRGRARGRRRRFSRMPPMPATRPPLPTVRRRPSSRPEPPAPVVPAAEPEADEWAAVVAPDAPGLATPAVEPEADEWAAVSPDRPGLGADAAPDERATAVSPADAAGWVVPVAEPDPDDWASVLWSDAPAPVVPPDSAPAPPPALPSEAAAPVGTATDTSFPPPALQTEPGAPVGTATDTSVPAPALPTEAAFPTPAIQGAATSPATALPT